MRFTRSALLAALVALPLLGACTEDESPIEPVVPAAGGELFQRYVALGNSITAGYVSGGITGNAQAQAYPVQLAGRAGAEFTFARLGGRGCTPTYRGPFVFDTVRVGPGATSTTCDLLAGPAPRLVNNLAVPGATLGDALNRNRPANPLSSLFLGGRSQVERMVEAQPTLVSVYLGNNDVLGGAGAGDTTRLTPASRFAAQVDSLVGWLKQTPAGQGGPGRDVVILGIAPFPALLQPGAYFFAQYSADPAGFQARTGKTVNANCAPAPGNAFAASLVSFAIFGQPAIPQIDCDGIAGVSTDFVLTPTETQALIGRVVAYNTALRGAATANGWTYVDVNEVIGGAGTTPATVRQRAPAAQFRLCQGLATAATPTAIQQAIFTTCPAPSDPTTPYTPGSAAYANFFGTWMTFDAVHPDVEFQTALARAIATALNAKHGTTLPTA
ncbi:MAG TPA: SGNH/GDSL hydrolase family protein [Longimicrobium sp.]|nr:SGNH/GDSL hydrolase family protein [Longimicrobium sp.]